MSSFKPQTTFDKVFEIGILLKGLDGLGETVGGIFLLLVDPHKINLLVKALTQNALNTNPHNFIADHLVHSANQLTKGAILFGAIYLLAHGIFKLILVFEILRGHLWAYIGLVILTTAFIVYQIYEIIFTHSVSLALLTIFDAIIVYLTVVEYKKQHHLRVEPASRE